MVIKNDDVDLIHLCNEIPWCTERKTESSSQNRGKDAHRKRDNGEELYQNVSIYHNANHIYHWAVEWLIYCIFLCIYFSFVKNYIETCHNYMYFTIVNIGFYLEKTIKLDLFWKLITSNQLIQLIQGALWKTRMTIGSSSLEQDLRSSTRNSPLLCCCAKSAMMGWVVLYSAWKLKISVFLKFFYHLPLSTHT